MFYIKQRKNRARKIVYSWPILILLLGLVLLVGKSVWGVYQSDKIARDNKKQSEEARKILEDKNSSMISEIEILETPKGVEKEIRNKFRVVKEGEQLAIIINSNKDEKKVIEENKKETIWTKIWNFLRD